MTTRVAILAAGLLLAGAGATAAPLLAPADLEEVAASPRQWTGVAVSREGRIFVNFPRWSLVVPVSVAELVDGEPRPYPDAAWNDWTPEDPVDAKFVCVQSVFVDDRDALWILDPANPWLMGVREGGPKLVKVDLARDEVERVYRLDAAVAPAGSYLNDVRVDTRTGTAYLTDSGLGALIVLDLATGAARRLLDGHPAVRAEDVSITIGETPFRLPDGSTPQIHSDGIALAPDRAHLYFQALTGHTLYRVPTAALRDAGLAAAVLADRVERVAASGVADGILFGEDGCLYLSALEESAVKRLTPGGELEVVVADPRLSWPDSFARGPGGWLYVTTSRIHEGPAPAGPYGIFRFRPPPAD